MISQFRLTDAALAFGGTLLNPDCGFSQVSIDSRHFADGDLFVAIKGERFDGHEFLGDIAVRASGLVVNNPDKNLPIPQWVVEDTTEALGQLARMNRHRFEGPLIAVTGSSGKTSVKEMIAAIHSQSAVVHATEGNLNNHIGVPLTLLSMDASADVAVIEMGASGAGEIAYLCDIAKPDITLVNNIQHAHIEGFGSIEAVASAKAEIYSGLNSNGTAVINLDLSWSQGWRDALANTRCITFSVEQKEADIYADNIEALAGGCYKFELCSGAKRLAVVLPMPGLHSVKNAVAAAACAIASGAGLEQIVNGLASVKPVSGRLNSYLLAEGVTLIDDTYNANPDSFKAAIDVLGAAEGHRVLVMGDMAELGEKAMEMHEEIGRYAEEKGIDALHSVGLLSAIAANRFGGTHHEDKKALISVLGDMVTEKTEITILIKGSRSSGMDEVVKTLSDKEIS
ncbi:MAG: UDP-N-acetylmuramoyl-tripeptide--D-alanyl-D-alanine ligase [Porticoccaceae bacterium]|nr:UDP-N-acetylmuramoyl-tripeptide--D-alanyl-D-alanine ligase [Porticoccaceae bacterium]